MFMQNHLFSTHPVHILDMALRRAVGSAWVSSG